jgi:hypothetical protein
MGCLFIKYRTCKGGSVDNGTVNNGTVNTDTDTAFMVV